MKSSHSRCRKVKKVLLHSRRFYYTAESFTAQQKVLPCNKRFYCVPGSFTAQQKILLCNRRFYCTVESFTTQQNSRSYGKNWRKVPSAAKVKDKPTLQCLPLDFNSTRTNWQWQNSILEPIPRSARHNFLLRKAQTKSCLITSRRVSKVQKT